MASFPLTVIIPTHGRPVLLERTLATLKACRRPDSYHELIVIENGSRDGAEEVVAALPDSMTARYMHRDRGNKSYALNEALSTIADGLVVFFDDDVRIDPNTLVAYAETAELYEPGEAYFGGPVHVDREVEPPAWLEPTLPYSARGYDLTHERNSPIYLGFNWAAFSTDIKRLGGFDPRFGPGSHVGATGQESEMQERLLGAGVEPVDVHNAIVTHHVPRERCTLRWMLGRKYRFGISNYYRYDKQEHCIEVIAKGGLRSGWSIVKGVSSFNLQRVVSGSARLFKMAGMVSGYLGSKQSN